METHHKIGLGSESSEATGHVHGSIGACSHHPVDIKDTSGSARPRSSGRGYVTSFSIGSALIIRSFSSKPDLVETGGCFARFPAEVQRMAEGQIVWMINTEPME